MPRTIGRSVLAEDDGPELPMIVIVEGVDLPGRRCRPDLEGHGHQNVHVGVCTKAGKRSGVEPIPGRPWGVTGLVRGDRDDRHVGLAWGEVGPDGAFEL